MYCLHNLGQFSLYALLPKEGVFVFELFLHNATKNLTVRNFMKNYNHKIFIFNALTSAEKML